MPKGTMLRAREESDEECRGERQVRRQCQSKTAAERISNLLWLSCTVMTLMPMKDHLICTKTAMRHFSNALVYDSGNRQRLLRARVMYMHALDGARWKTRY